MERPKLRDYDNMTAFLDASREYNAHDPVKVAADFAAELKSQRDLEVAILRARIKELEAKDFLDLLRKNHRLTMHVATDPATVDEMLWLVSFHIGWYAMYRACVSYVVRHRVVVPKESDLRLFFNASHALEDGIEAHKEEQ